MKWQTDLIKDIRTHTEYDDYDYDEAAMRSVYDGSVEVTDCNRFALMQQFMRVQSHCSAILEIGVCRNAEQSFTHVFLNSKKKDTIYVGIDIDDRSYLNNVSENVHTIRADSSDYYDNVLLFKSFGIEKFDFIFIDGWHSINQVLRDWEYTNLLGDKGIIGFHDTSCHPGPYNFVKALDPDKWNVHQNMCPKDWGIGFAWRK